MSLRIRILYGLFAISGFCGLIYESVWSHYLKLFLGHAAYAQTVVLIVFIGGLALGSWLAGHFATRIARPLLAYAAAELAVGLCAIFFHGAFVRSTDWAYAHLLPAMCSAQGWCWAQWVFAGLLILPQSVLLGTTFPLMSGGILRLDPGCPGRTRPAVFPQQHRRGRGRVVERLRADPRGGPSRRAFHRGPVERGPRDRRVFRRQEHPAVGTGARGRLRARGRDARPPAVALFLAVALLTGLSSFIYEIVWTRSLSLVLGASTHSFELMLASFIFGLALGGLWIRGRIDRAGDVPRFLGVVQVVMGVLGAAHPAGLQRRVRPHGVDVGCRAEVRGRLGAVQPLLELDLPARHVAGHVHGGHDPAAHHARAARLAPASAASATSTRRTRWAGSRGDHRGAPRPAAPRTEGRARAGRGHRHRARGIPAVPLRRAAGPSPWAWSAGGAAGVRARCCSSTWTRSSSLRASFAPATRAWPPTR